MRRAVVLVGAGSGSRFGGDKTMTLLRGEPVISRTVRAFRGLVDDIVAVVSNDRIESVEALGLGVTLTVGGSTRTESEVTGLAALGDECDLIGIHDTARPLVSRGLIEAVYAAAAAVGGAAPVTAREATLITRGSLEVVEGASTVQTPQVFRGPDLISAYGRAASDGFIGHDTVEVMHRYSDVSIAAVPGDEMNLKITYQSDLDRAVRLLEEVSRT